MTISNARRNAPMMVMLLLLTVTPTTAGTDGAQDSATRPTVRGESPSDRKPAKQFHRGLLALHLSAVSEAATADVNGAPLAVQSPAHATAASNKVPESHDSNLNRVGFFVGATTKTNGDTEFATGLEYERRFTDLLGAGLVVEWEPSFEERVLVAPALFVHPVGELLITVAPGAQFEEHGTQFVFRLGAAWEFELGHGLALAPTVNYDFVEGAHDAISYGLVLNFAF